MLNANVEQINERSLAILDTAGTQTVVEPDTVVLVVESEPRNSLIDSIIGAVSKVVCVGDCVRAGRIYEAINEAYIVAKLIWRGSTEITHYELDKSRLGFPLLRNGAESHALDRMVGSLLGHTVPFGSSLVSTDW